MDAVFGFISSNMVLIGFIWGIIVKYAPGLSKVPNALIPYMNAILALLTGLVAPATAHASFGSFMAGPTFFGHIASAAWAAIQSALIFEVFGRHPLNAMGAKKN